MGENPKYLIPELENLSEKKIKKIIPLFVKIRNIKRRK